MHQGDLYPVVPTPRGEVPETLVAATHLTSPSPHAWRSGMAVGRMSLQSGISSHPEDSQVVIFQQ